MMDPERTITTADDCKAWLECHLEKYDDDELILIEIEKIDELNNKRKEVEG